MTRDAADVGRGLAAAREARPIPAGQRIHVIGAAGAGASAAALLAAAAGAEVTACDPGAPTPYTEALEEIAIEVVPEHSASHVLGRDGTATVDRVGVTKALTSIAPDHPELAAARQAGIAPEAWQQVIADAAATQGGRLIGIAGTHGKSTSAGWLVHLLVGAGKDPGAFVGALLPAELTGGTSATGRWGSGDAFVVEADEYAGNFDAYRPEVAVILNADWDHPDVFADEAAVLDAFEGWLRAPGSERRTCVINVGDAGGARLAERLSGWAGRIVRVSLDRAENAPAYDADGVADEGAAAADVVGHAGPQGRLAIDGLHALDGTGGHDAAGGLGAAGGGLAAAGRLETTLGLSGRHNAANALSVAAAASLLGVEREAIAQGLRTFRGVGRRLELKGEPLGVTIYDDYGHHPTAIAASIAALRERHPGRRLIAVYEPLTFHRTAAMLEEFAEVMAAADAAFVADIWAGRDPDTTVTSAIVLADRINARGRAPALPTGSVEATADSLVALVRRGDVVLIMGGGRSYVIADRLLEGLTALADAAVRVD
ncbi:MAG: UDP-N-acetylmuramate--alanine ligase [Chloroflexota bacterium]|jgi:UDP-N-acetylmuramate--alanine ligase|nr:UDP-N-acetylmuramate--alanine ligase [Chloroflexota bacterium]